jgi:hypothetical protein
MTDMGIPYDTKKATKDMAEGDPAELQAVHAPPDDATAAAAKAQHAYATTSSVDPPTGMGGGHHGHRGNPKK